MQNKGTKWMGRIGYSFIVAWIVLILLDVLGARLFWQEGRLIHLDSVHVPPSLKTLFFLGSDHLGRDLLGMLIEGAKVSLVIGICSALISMMLGFILGIFSAMSKQETIKISIWTFLAWLIPFIVLLPILVFQSRWSTSILVILLFLFVLSIILAKRIKASPSPIHIYILSIVDIIQTVPFIVLLLIILPWFGQEYWQMTIVFGLFRWTYFYRIADETASRILPLPYIQQTKLLGLKPIIGILKHILPNILPLLLGHLPYVILGNILLEATVSFFGFGFSPDRISWGAILASSSQYLNFWWIPVFTSFAIALTAMSFQWIGKSKVNEVL